MDDRLQVGKHSVCNSHPGQLSLAIFENNIYNILHIIYLSTVTYIYWVHNSHDSCSRRRTTVVAVRDSFGSKNLSGQIFWPVMYSSMHLKSGWMDSQKYFILLLMKTPRSLQTVHWQRRWVCWKIKICSFVYLSFKWVRLKTFWLPPYTVCCCSFCCCCCCFYQHTDVICLYISVDASCAGLANVCLHELRSAAFTEWRRGHQHPDEDSTQNQVIG